MQDIIFSLLQRISSLPEIAYASADWGQLSYNVPPVEYPCTIACRSSRAPRASSP